MDKELNESQALVMKVVATVLTWVAYILVGVLAFLTMLPFLAATVFEWLLWIDLFAELVN